MIAIGDAPPAAPTSWWQRRSLRARLTAAATVVITVGMVAAAALLVWRVHTSLAASLDATLIRQVRVVADDITSGDRIPRMPRSAAESTVLQVTDAAGRVIVSSGDIDGDPRVFFLTPGTGAPAIATATAPAAVDGASFRVAAQQITTPSGPVTVYVGSPTAPLTAATTELATTLAAGVPAIIVLLGMVGWWLLGTALRPVDAIGRQAAAIPGTDLHRRLDVPPSGDELARLATTFNDLLARIDAATDRHRRFVADAAHELRTPLAALRARMEIDLRHPPPDPAATVHARRQSLQQVTRLADLVDDLLQLARLDAGGPQRLPRRPVDLDDLVWEAAREARDQAPPHIDTTGISPVRVLGDAPALRQVVRNLFDNARRHAYSTVTIELQTDRVVTPIPGGAIDAGAATATLTVADDGPGIPPAERRHVFERFVRLDDARARDAGGAGLGLAIVADIVAAHGGTVDIDDNHPGARIRVRLPTLL